jgi:magnesium transporter
MHNANAEHRDEHPPLTPESLTLTEGLKGTVDLLMEPATGYLSPETTVAGALDYLVHALPKDGITYLYVVDRDNRLIGVVAMRDLLLSRPGQTLQEVMTGSPFAFRPDTDMGEAMQAALNRRHRLYPVVSEEGTLLGLVMGWRLFQHLATELSAQSGSMVGVDKEERSHTPILQAFKMRHPWLQVNLLTAFAAAFVVGMFEDTITRIVALAAFLPVLAGQSGNTGSQALAITLRGLTLGELADYPVRRLLRKEIILGALNGFAVGLVAAAAMWVYAVSTGTEHPAILALVILVSMVGACVGSGIFGVVVPLTLRRFGADPAMASSIFLTTFTDVLGMGLMLLLATMLLM